MASCYVRTRRWPRGAPRHGGPPRPAPGRGQSRPYGTAGTATASRCTRGARRGRGRSRGCSPGHPQSHWCRRRLMAEVNRGGASDASDALFGRPGEEESAESRTRAPRRAAAGTSNSSAAPARPGVQTVRLPRDSWLPVATTDRRRAVPRHVMHRCLSVRVFALIGTAAGPSGAQPARRRASLRWPLFRPPPASPRRVARWLVRVNLG